MLANLIESAFIVKRTLLLWRCRRGLIRSYKRSSYYESIIPTPDSSRVSPRWWRLARRRPIGPKRHSSVIPATRRARSGVGGTQTKL